METTTQQSRETVAAFWATMQTNNFRAVGDLLADTYVLEWPQSKERICGRANFIAVNEHYPAAGRWQFTIHRLIADGGEVASEVTVTDGAITARVLTFSTVRTGKIIQQTEYWPDPYEAAPWRAEWVEYMEQ